MKFPWTKRIEQLEAENAALAKSSATRIAALLVELDDANAKYLHEAQRRMFFEGIANERLAAIEVEKRRADDACKARDEAMKLVTVRAIEEKPDPKQFQPVQAKRRTGPNWFGPEFVQTYQKMTRGEAMKVPPAPAETESVN